MKRIPLKLYRQIGKHPMMFLMLHMICWFGGSFFPLYILLLLMHKNQESAVITILTISCVITIVVGYFAGVLILLNYQERTND